MELQWLKSFRKCIDRNAPMIATGGYGSSRRIEGSYGEAETERQCYHDLYCYVQTGLGSFEKPIFDLLSLVHRFQKDRERGLYTICIRWFGSKNQRVKPMSFLAHPFQDMRSLAKGLCKDSGKTLPAGPLLLPSLKDIETNDLIIFFCLGRRVRMKVASRGKYRSQRRRIFWAFLDGAEPELVGGVDFEPKLSET